MRRLIAAATAAIALAFAGSAGAATVFGTFTSGYSSGPIPVADLGITGTGNWQIDFQISQPELVSVSLDGKAVWAEWTPDGKLIWANEVGGGSYAASQSPSSAGSLFVRWKRNVTGQSVGYGAFYDPRYPSVFRDERYMMEILYFWLPSAAPGQTINYSVTATWHSAVPEPATWALLIAGFGLVGSGLRRQLPRATTSRQ